MHRSITGYIIFVHGVPICWRSRGQKSVTLSSTKVEWVALLEATKDVIFMMHLCKGIGLCVRFPITVCVDNLRAIFMSQNVSTMGHNKYAQVRRRCVVEHVEVGIPKKVFVKSEDNTLDIMTKNLGHRLYSKHAQELVIGK